MDKDFFYAGFILGIAMGIIIGMIIFAFTGGG